MAQRDIHNKDLGKPGSYVPPAWRGQEAAHAAARAARQAARHRDMATAAAGMGTAFEWRSSSTDEEAWACAWAQEEEPEEGMWAGYRHGPASGQAPVVMPCATPMPYAARWSQAGCAGAAAETIMLGHEY